MPLKSHSPAVGTQIAKLLRAERVRQKLSLTAVAERAGLSQQMVSYVERELRNPTLDTFLRIADVLGSDPAELLHVALLRAGAKKSYQPVSAEDEPLRLVAETSAKLSRDKPTPPRRKRKNGRTT